MENNAPVAAEAELLLGTLRSFNKPVAFASIWAILKEKDERPTEQQAKQILLELVKKGLVRRAGKDKKIVFWLPALEPQACERICAVLAAGPCNKSQLKNNLPSLLPGWPPVKREELFKQLLHEGRIYKWPPLKGNISLFSLQPPAPQSYLQKPFDELTGKIQRLVKQFAAAGITPEQVYAIANELWQQALPENAPVGAERQPAGATAHAEPPGNTTDLAQLILAGMQQFKASPLVSLTELRRSLAATVPGKTTFDQIVLQLASQGCVVLHRHDYPGSLSQAERAELVNDEHGNYYVGIALNA